MPSLYINRETLLDLFGVIRNSRGGKAKAAAEIVREHGIAEYPEAGSGNRIVYLRSEVVAKAKKAMNPLPTAA